MSRLRATPPGWSTAGGGQLPPASIAALPSSSARVGAGPPLSCSGPSRGSAPERSPAPCRPQLASSRLWPSNGGGIGPPPVRTVGGRPAGHQRLLQLEREGVDEPCPSTSPSGCVATCRTGSRILASRSPPSARWRNASHRRSCPAPASPECGKALPSLRRDPADAAGGSGPAVRRRRAADANLRADAARGQGARRRLTRLPRSCRGRRRWPKQVSRLAVLALLANVALAVAACGKSSVRDPVHRSCLSCGGERVRH